MTFKASRTSTDSDDQLLLDDACGSNPILNLAILRILATTIFIKPIWN